MTAHRVSDPLQWLDQAWQQAGCDRAVEVEGALVTYRTWNEGATHLPGLLFLGGFRANAYWWDHVAPFFTETHRVAAITLSGMGDSGWRASYHVPQYAREMLAVAAHAGFGRFSIVAHSFGGSPTLAVCLQAPGLVEHAILVDCVLEDLGGMPRFEFQDALPKAFNSLEEAMKRFRFIPPGRWPQPRIMAHIARHSLKQTEAGWVWKFDPATAVLVHRAFDDGVQHVAVRMDYVYGDSSEIATAPRVAYIRSHLASCRRFVTIPACHHHVMVEQPLALVAALRALLAV